MMTSWTPESSPDKVSTGDAHKAFASHIQYQNGVRIDLTSQILLICNCYTKK